MAQLRSRTVLTAVLTALAMAGAHAQNPVTVTQTPVTQTPVTQTPVQVTQTPISWADWLAAFRAEASSKGISDATLDAALTNLTQDPTAVERDKTQPELTQTLEAYIAARLTTKVMTNAAAAMKAQGPLLDRINQAYGVPPGVMVAVWGMESNFGQIQGSHPIISALATLAYNGRRQLFRNELLEALTIVDKKLAPMSDLKGSWAGAMGQPQFMPSSYRKFAVDFDGDGVPDIWTSVDDVFASMANYLQKAGWVAGERWGREIDVPAKGWDDILAAVPMRTTGCQARKEMTVARPLKEWRKLGVTLLGSTRLPALDLPASLVRGDHRAFLVYHNYDALIDYNCSNAYALSVGLLSDIAAGTVPKPAAKTSSTRTK